MNFLFYVAFVPDRNAFPPKIIKSVQNNQGGRGWRGGVGGAGSAGRGGAGRGGPAFFGLIVLD